METLTPRNTLKVTINPDVNSDLILAGWPINTQSPIIESEPERVNIEKGNRSYSLVFTSDGPKLEVWEIEADGELGALKATFDIPE